MNTTTASTQFRNPRALIATTVLGALVSTFAAVCSAADSDEVPTAVVRYADLDISTAQGATTLYNRIRFTAERLCAPFSQGDPLFKLEAKACVQRAIEGAVAKVNRPALSALYAAKHEVSRPAKFLTADRR